MGALCRRRGVTSHCEFQNLIPEHGVSYVIAWPNLTAVVARAVNGEQTSLHERLMSNTRHKVSPTDLNGNLRSTHFHRLCRELPKLRDTVTSRHRLERRVKI